MRVSVKNETVTKYLDRYAEPEAAIKLPGRHYEHSLVIPAFHEDQESVRKVWRRIKPSTSFLVILVVNSNVEEDPSARMLIDGLTLNRQISQLTNQIQLVEKIGGAEGPDLLVIDRYSRGYSIDKKQGVGLARKIGMDIAASLINQRVVSGNWLFTTDADAELPENYFNLETGDADAAFIYPFKHVAPPGLKSPMQLYEISMLYYLAGLLWANSPYAYPTIGSTISCSLDRYAAVRGFPKRNTGEDFYLLNKLRKIGKVTLGNGDPIIISGRISNRVPIGTGQAIRAIHELGSPIADFTLEDPRCFSQLKYFLDWLNAISVTQPKQLLTGDPDTDEYVRHIGLMPHYEHKRLQSPTPGVMRKHLHDWFDGLKTRQFIHYFRDQHFGRVTVAELENIPFMSNITDEARDLDILLDTITASLHTFIYHQNAC
jgi:hypothetical protein